MLVTSIFIYFLCFFHFILRTAWMCAFSHARLDRFETSRSWKLESVRRFVSKGDWKDDFGGIIYVCRKEQAMEEVFFINTRINFSIFDAIRYRIRLNFTQFVN